MRELKYNSKLFLCLLIFHLIGTYSVGFSGKYPIQNFTSSQYKAGIQNIDFAQNRDMGLFVANNLGVLAYDGKDWVVHAVKSGKKMRSLAFDESVDRLYVGSQGSFGYFEKEWKYTSLNDLIPAAYKDFDEVWDVFRINGQIYFCTFQGIYIYDGSKQITVLRHEGGLDRSFHIAGKLFSQSPTGRLLEVDGNRLKPTSNQQLIQNRIIAGIVPLNGGKLLFYNSGEIEFTTAYGEAEQYHSLSNVIQGTFVNHVLQLSDARIAISTQTAGLFLYDLQSQTLEQITTNDGLQTNACLRTFQDFSGNLWVGMQNGIALIDINAPMRFINQEINLQGSGYEVFAAEDGTYFTTSNGIFYLSDNNTQSVFLAETEGPAYGMQQIAGKLYAGHHTGLFLLENGKAKRIAKTDGLWQIKQYNSKPEYAIAGTYSGLYLFRLNSNLELEPVQKIDGFNESSRFFEEDQKGRIWVGQFYKGLYKLNFSENLAQAQVDKISFPSDFPIDDQLIINRVDDELYVGTRAGLFKVDQNSDRIVSAEKFSKEIGAQSIYLIAQDKQKNVHIVAENQVGFFKQISSNNYSFIPSSLMQTRYSFNNDLLNVSIHTESGVMFNANEGFIHYQPEREEFLSNKKPPIICRVYSVTEDSVIYSREPFALRPQQIEPLTLSPKTKLLQFHVESFRFNEMNNLQYRYFLKGFEQGVESWTDATVKEYTNLREGDYEFVVQTKNYLGNIESSEPLLLTVKPPFYRSILARIIYVLLGIMALVFISRVQKQRYKEKARKVEALKQKELALKQQELVEIEQQKEKEVRELEDDKMRVEMQHINKLLAASTMNLVVKNEFIENIKEKLKEVKHLGKNVETKEALEQIVKEIDMTLRLQEDWEQFEHHFDQVHGDFLTRIRSEFADLTANEQKLCAFLRLNLNTKDISNLMGISLRGVEVARYRLRKKLRLDKRQNLSKYILEY